MQDVSGYVLGEHGESQFTAWSTVQVAGASIFEVAKQRGLQLNNLKEQARMGAWKIIAGKHFTAYGIGLSTTVICEAIVTDSNRALAVSVYDPLLGTYIGQVARIGSAGIIATSEILLMESEENARASSAASILQMFESIDS